MDVREARRMFGDGIGKLCYAAAESSEGNNILITDRRSIFPELYQKRIRRQLASTLVTVAGDFDPEDVTRICFSGQNYSKVVEYVGDLDPTGVATFIYIKEIFGSRPIAWRGLRDCHVSKLCKRMRCDISYLKNANRQNRSENRLWEVCSKHHDLPDFGNISMSILNSGARVELEACLAYEIDILI